LYIGSGGGEGGAGTIVLFLPYTGVITAGLGTGLAGISTSYGYLL